MSVNPRPKHSLELSQARRLSELGRQALIAEALLTPKPGLVDARGPGAHRDLSLAIMIRSACAIEPYFLDMALTSAGRRPTQSLREELALIGRHAERAMLDATDGSNAHKGAIWALGLLISAAAMQDAAPLRAHAVADTARCIARHSDRRGPQLVTHGEVVKRRFGAAGARGEAIRGFPHVVDIGLPVLQSERQKGHPPHLARLNALLSIMARLDDTCLLYRGGASALRTAKDGAAAVLAAGGAATKLGASRLRALDGRLIALNLSPGGSADLLAATLLLDAMEAMRDERS